MCLQSKETVNVEHLVVGSSVFCVEVLSASRMILIFVHPKMVIVNELALGS